MPGPGATVTSAGTEFTTSGLVTGDTVTGVTLTSAGAPASAAVACSPFAVVPSAAAGTGLGKYTISYANGALTVNKESIGCSVSSSLAASKHGKSVTFKDGETVMGSPLVLTYGSGDRSPRLISSPQPPVPHWKERRLSPA